MSVRVHTRFTLGETRGARVCMRSALEGREACRRAANIVACLSYRNRLDEYDVSARLESMWRGERSNRVVSVID